MAEGTQKGETKFNVKDLIKKILQSPPIIVYVVMVILSMASLNLPSVITDLAVIIGGANTFLAMFMIGIALELNFDRENVAKLMKFVALRYIPAAALGLIVSVIPVIPVAIKYALILVLLAPVSGSATIFTEKIKNDIELSAQFNSLSIILSIILMSSYLIYLGV